MAGRRILVLLTDAFGGHGGIALYNRDVLTALCADPTIVDVVALPRVAALPLGALPAKLTYDLASLGGVRRFALRALRHVLSGRFDAIYCAHLNLMPLARWIARIARAPLVLAIYGIEAWQPLKHTRRGAGAADHVISISQVTLDRFRAWHPYPDARCSIAPNAIHLDQFGLAPRDQAMARRYGVEDRKVLLTFGRLAASERYKGFDRLLGAMVTLRELEPDLTYLIAGDGDDRPRLEARARELGLADRVVFTGRIDEVEKADLYCLADVYAMPSTGEGFGFVLLEAMACGVPVIASNADGGREAVRGGELGLVVDPDDEAALIEAVRACLVKPKAIPEGLAYFAFPRFTERITAIMNGVMARR